MSRESPVAALQAIFYPAILFIVLTVVSTHYIESYGASLFIILPLVCGALCTLLYNRSVKRGFGENLLISFASYVFTNVGFFIVGLEGAGCLLMAIPILLPLFFIGSAIGYSLSSRLKEDNKTDLLSIFLAAMTPCLMGMEAAFETEPIPREVTSTVIIEGTVEDVWQEVVAFSPIPEPDELMFRGGIAYPTHAEIVGEGVGAIRYCHFSTGEFVEPITHWEEGKKLAFDVAEQPHPMIETSPYGAIHPPHLDWSFVSEKGQFLINDLGDGRIELIGTTWYHMKIQPEAYWGWISDYIIHEIHLRVLNHIKKEIETP